MSAQNSIIRVSTFAHAIGAQSKDVIEVLNLVAPDMPIKSASSRLEISRDNEQFFKSVAHFVRLRRDARDNRFVIV